MRCRWGDGLRNSSEGNEEMKQENGKECSRLGKTLRKGRADEDDVGQARREEWRGKQAGNRGGKTQGKLKSKNPAYT